MRNGAIVYEKRLVSWAMAFLLADERRCWASYSARGEHLWREVMSSNED